MVIEKPKGKVFEKIRKIVAQIPRGKVVTYGQVSRLVGIQDARVVGWAMWGNQNPKIPCHRVLKKDGFLAENYFLEGWKGQKKRLEKEGISFVEENRVDLKRHQWKDSEMNSA